MNQLLSSRRGGLRVAEGRGLLFLAGCWGPGEPGVRTMTGGDGRYELTLRLSRGWVGAVARDHWPAHLPVEAGADGVEQDLMLEPLGPIGSVRGEVRAEGGAAVAHATCIVESRLPSGSPREVWCGSDGAGVFVCDGVPAGPATLRIHTEDHPELVKPIVVEHGAPTFVQVLLPSIARATLAVQVRDAAGEPVAEVEVSVAALPLGIAPYAEGQRTGADGRVVLRGIPSGPAKVIVNESPRLGHAVDVVVPDGGTLEVPVVLAVGRERIDGTIRRPDGRPARTVEVLVEGLEHAGTPLRRLLYLEEGGRFSADGLPAGRYAISTRTPSAPQHQRRAEVELPGPPVELVLDDR